MAKKIINVGQTSNDRDGDSLRAAFIKINGNFDELYTGLEGFNLTNAIPSLGGNSGKYLTNNGSTLSWGTVDFPTDISQLTDNTNLLQSSSGLVEVSANPPASPVVGKLWYDTESGRTYVRYDDSWVDANPKAAAINLASVTQSIIPSMDATYDLGSSSKQWRSLYVSTNTIYINNVPLSIDEGGVLLVDGEPVSGGGQVLEIDGGYASTDYTAELTVDGGGA